jgi:hypothetical protein
MLPELNKERKTHPGTLEKYGKAIIWLNMPGSYRRRKPMKPIICFIDDSKFEHDLIQNQIAPLAPHFKWVQAYTFDEAKLLLMRSAPALFLLDLWGQDDSRDPSGNHAHGGCAGRNSPFPLPPGRLRRVEGFQGGCEQ